MNFQKTSPEISVIVPVYNCGPYLERCLDSILSQSFTDIEILCIDDGSTDRSPEILKNYRSKDKRIKVFHQQNMGAGAARNFGLRNAKGKYLSFLDADDFFESSMYEKAYAKAIKDQADFVVFNSDQYYSSKNEYEKLPWTIRTEDLPSFMPFSYEDMAGNIFFTFVGWAWDKLYLHSFVTENDLWFQEQRTTNDMLFVFSALILAKRITVLNEDLVHHRCDRKDSLSNTREESWYCFYDALKEVKDFLVKEGRYEVLEQDFINYVLNFSLWQLNSLPYPEKDLMGRKLVNEWFDELKVNNRDKDYFYNPSEFRQYLDLLIKYDTSEEEPL